MSFSPINTNDQKVPTATSQQQGYPTSSTPGTPRRSITPPSVPIITIQRPTPERAKSHQEQTDERIIAATEGLMNQTARSQLVPANSLKRLRDEQSIYRPREKKTRPNPRPNLLNESELSAAQALCDLSSQSSGSRSPSPPSRSPTPTSATSSSSPIPFTDNSPTIEYFPDLTSSAKRKPSPTTITTDFERERAQRRRMISNQTSAQLLASSEQLLASITARLSPLPTPPPTSRERSFQPTPQRLAALPTSRHIPPIASVRRETPTSSSDSRSPFDAVNKMLTK